jgi:hypothetical protein
MSITLELEYRVSSINQKLNTSKTFSVIVTVFSLFLPFNTVAKTATFTTVHWKGRVHLDSGSKEVRSFYHYSYGRREDGVMGNTSEWRDFIYKGPAYYCNTQSPADCDYRFEDSKAVSYSYTVGLNAGQFATWGGFVTANFTQTFNNNHAWNYSTKVKRGWSARPVVFVWRRFEGWYINGAWYNVPYKGPVPPRGGVPYVYEWRGGKVEGTDSTGHRVISSPTASYLTKRGYFPPD